MNEQEANVPGHAFSATTMSLFLRMVLTGVSMRAVCRVFEILAEVWGVAWKPPDWTTGRMWLLRFGHFQLTCAKEQAEDWVWLIDHSVQIGPQKCLAIVGLRLCRLPEQGECLKHIDLQLIALEPMQSSTKHDIRDRLEAASAVAGVPRVIVDDRGADLTGGVRLFQENHPQTVEIHDTKHKAACLLKARLERDPRWQRFQSLIGQTRCAIQQTELAFLVPPGPKPKARSMNLQPMLDWAANVLEVLRRPPAAVLACSSEQRLREKLGWLEEFREVLAEWREWQQMIDAAVEHVGHEIVLNQTAPFYLWGCLVLGHQSGEFCFSTACRFLTSHLPAFIIGQRNPKFPTIGLLQSAWNTT